MYKAPSTIHETVVATLRKEKDNLAMALSCQREASNTMATKVTQITIRMNELEQQNEELLDAQASDKNALSAMDDRYSQAMAEIDALKARLSDQELQLANAR